MNRLRTHKFKPNVKEEGVPKVGDSGDAGGKANCQSALNSSGSGGALTPNGLLNKISKRYSTLSSKITRRTLPGRKSTSPANVATGSYDMTGANSDDHRLEIGAPVLISTTTLDTDRLDVTAARLLAIGGGIAATSTVIRQPHSTQSSPQIPSSGSENEVYVDALGPPTNAKRDSPTIETEDSEKFELAPQAPAKPPREASKERSPDSRTTDEASPERTNPLASYYEAAKALKKRPKMAKKQHSKSAHNLHRSELKVFLQKAPSVELDLKLTTADLEHCHDLPRLPELYGCATDDDGAEADKENSSPSVTLDIQSKSLPNTPLCGEEKVTGFLAQQQQFRSIDSLEIHQNKIRRSSLFASDASLTQNGSKSSLNSHNTTLANFDLKSVSCQSLNAPSLFVSIDELNEITRQINESEDFNQEIDLEYCTHRDNLRPSERRITLLKNKNSTLISFNNNKEKIRRGWTGMKHWIGEESTKLKEVVHMQGTLQRVASSRLNLRSAECRKSPSMHGSAMLGRDSRSVSREPTLDEAGAGSLQRPMVASQNNLDVSSENVASEAVDFSSSFSQLPADGASPPLSKRVRREGQNGFEELRRYVKQGGDFGKELILILQERVDSELLYSKSLTKMANKLNKACRELPGSIADAWRGVATEMESRSDIHRQLSVSLTDEIVKPLKTIVENQHKARKTIECNVDKSARMLAEWRISEAKAKKSSHTAARDNEKLQDAMLDVRIQKSPSIALLHQGPNKLAAEKEIKSAEKDCAKLDNKRKKAEEAVKRADVEYYTLCVRAERARVDWEMAVLRGSSHLQTIENQRLVNMKNFVANYARLTDNMNPILDTLAQRMQPQVEACNVLKDMQVVKNIRRNSEGPSEQLLPDFYCEHTTLAMNRERRKHALIKLLQLVKADLERERRSRNGLKGLSQSLNTQEHQNITDKLYHIRSMLTYLEGARFKLHSALLELDHKPRSAHPLSQHIQITRDRTGLQQSILKVPLWLKNNDRINTSGGTDESWPEGDFDSSAPTNLTNVSTADLSSEISPVKSFNRSKSNIETFHHTTTTITFNHANKGRSANDPYSDRGQADGGSNQQDSDFDEFSSQDEDEEQQQQQLSTSGGRKEHKAIMEKSAALLANGSGKDCLDHQYQNSAELKAEQQLMSNNHNNTVSSQKCPPAKVLSKCKALYSYTPKLYDELELNPGDVIEVHAKQEDGWWLGALGNQVGIFPATYVEEFA